MKEYERLKFALPKKEWQKPVLSFMQAIGLEFEAVEKCQSIIVDNMPVTFVLMRAKGIPKNVFDPRSASKANITGSDILWEKGYGRDFGEEIPIYDLDPEAKRSKLYVGVEKDFLEDVKEKLREPNLQELLDKGIASEYVRISEDFCRENGIQTEIFDTSDEGSAEAMPQLYQARAVIDVSETGKAAELNGIEVLQVFYEVSLRMIQADEKLTRIDRAILDDFKERIAVALERKKMLSCLI